MASIQISQTDIDNLAKKLDEFSAVLSPNEQALLHAIFGMAGMSVSGAASESESGGVDLSRGMTGFSDAKISITGNLPKLSSGFLDAFRPVRPGRFTFGQGIGTNAAVGVGGSTVTWTR